MPDESGVTVVTMLVCFFVLHARLRRVERPAFPAPSEFQMALHSAKLARCTRRDRGRVGGLSDAVIARSECDEPCSAVMPGHSSLHCADGVNFSALPGIHVLSVAHPGRTWMAGTSPAMTTQGWFGEIRGRSSRSRQCER